MSSNLSDLEKMLDAAVADALQAAGEYAVEQARSTNLFTIHPNSKFKEKIITQPVAKNKQVVWSQADYSSYLEEGTAPHTIKGNPYLHFYWEKKDVWIKTKAVNHPGTTPRPFMANAAQLTEEHLHTLWQHSLDKHFK